MGAVTLDGFGMAEKPAAIAACGAIVQYARRTQRAALEHVHTITYRETADYLILDPSTARNLELVESAAGDGKDTLLSVLDRTVTGMGARLLRHWILRPAIDPAEIISRLDAVGELT